MADFNFDYEFIAEMEMDEWAKEAQEAKDFYFDSSYDSFIHMDEMIPAMRKA